MAWKNLEADLAGEFSNYVYDVGWKDEDEDSQTGSRNTRFLGGWGAVELERRRNYNRTRHERAEKTGLCIVCNAKPIRKRRGGKSIHCSRTCRLKDAKFRAGGNFKKPISPEPKMERNLTEQQRAEIRSFVGSRGLGDWLAKRYGVSISAISRIRNK